MEKIGDIFQQKTKYIRNQMSEHRVDLSSKPALYKQYHENEKIALPTFEPLEKLVLIDLIKKRRSVREFTDKPVSKEILSYRLCPNRS